MKRKVFIVCFIILFSILVSSVVLGEAARPTYINRHYFQNGTYEIREHVIRNKVTWTRANSPYLVEDRVIIRPGGDLTIEEGVEILFHSQQGAFMVEDAGQLNIEGRLDNEVVFSKYADKDWDGLYFQKGSLGNISFAHFKYGGTGYRVDPSLAMINIASSDVEIRNTVFSNSISPGLALCGPINPLVENVKFHVDNQYLIVQDNVNANPQLTDLASNKDFAGIKIIAGLGTEDSSSIYKKIIWKDPSLPYIVDGWLNIGDGSTLTIEPGVEVLFNQLNTNLQGNITVEANGSLIAKGVRFASRAGDEYWDYIYSREGSKLVLQDIVIENAGYSGKGALRIDSGDSRIEGTDVLNSKSYGLYFGKSDIEPRLENVSIKNSKSYAMYLAENAKPSYRGILYQDNGKNGIFVGRSQLYGKNFWSKEEGPYYLDGVYSLEPGAVLEIGPGTTICFEDGAGTGGSSIIAKTSSRILTQGRDHHPVIFTNGNEDNGALWGSIILESGSTGRFDYSIFQYGGEDSFYPWGEGPNYGVLNLFSHDVVVHNSIFRDLANNAIHVGDGVAPYSIYNNQFYIKPDSFALYKWDQQPNIYTGGNWWNDATGPYNMFINPGGHGPMVGQGVNIFPFLEEPWGRVEDWELWGEKIVSGGSKAREIKFNQALDKEYVNTSYINVINSDGEFIAIDVGLINRDTIRVKPKHNYKKGSYKLLIKNGIRSVTGKVLDRGIVVEFEIK